MGLEHNQRLDNDVKVHAGNISASNDASQWIHDSNDLLKGAKFLAAAQELGLSEEEALQLASRKRQRQTPESAALQDAFMDRFDALMPAELDGVKYEGEEEWAFGQDQSDFQTRYKKTSKRRNQHGTEFYSVDDQRQIEDTYEEYKEPIYGVAPSRRMGKDASGKRWPYEELHPIILGYSGDDAPVSGMRDALDRLRQGTQQFGYDVFPGSADAEGRLEQDINLGSAQAKSDRGVAQELARRDSNRFSLTGGVRSYLAAEAEAEAIARDQRLSMNNEIADAVLARVGNINGLGVAMPHFYHRPGADQLRVSTQQNFPSAAMVNGVYADPRTGEPLAVQGPAEPLAKSNTPNTHQQLNAPQSSREWVGSQIEGMRADPFPQADINASTALFSQRLAPILQKFGVDTTNLSPNVRSLAEVDKAVETVVRLSKGSRLLEQRVPGTVPGTFKRVAVENPGLEQVLGAMRYSDVEKAQFANALYALTMQEQSSVNQEATRRFQSRGERAFADSDVTFDAPTGGKSVQGARIPGGRRLEGSTIVSQLRGLSGRGGGGERLSEEELRAARSPRQGLAINPDGSTEQPRIDRRVPAGMDSTDAIAKEKRERMEGYAAKAGKAVDEAALRKHTVGAQLAYLRQQRAEGKPTARRRPETIWDEPASTRPAFPRNYQAPTSPQAGADPFGEPTLPVRPSEQGPALAPIDRSDVFGGGTIPQRPKAREQEIRVERTMRPPGQTFGQQRPVITSQPDGPTNTQGVRNEIIRRAKLGRDMRNTAIGAGGSLLALAGINGLINRDQGGL